MVCVFRHSSKALPNRNRVDNPPKEVEKNVVCYTTAIMLQLQRLSRIIIRAVIYSVVLPTVVQQLPLTEAIRSLESDPASDGGVLTAGVGQQIVLTCSHDNNASGSTGWKISAPVDCTGAYITTLNIIIDCGPFSIASISEVFPYTTTATATATTSMTGAVVQCLDGTDASATQVGSSITLCIYDNPPPPSNLQCQPMSNGTVVISWSPVPQDCTMSSVYYTISIIMTEELRTTSSTSEQFSLTPVEEYVATVMTVVNDTVHSTMRVSEGKSCTFTSHEILVPLTMPSTTSNPSSKGPPAESGTPTDTTTAVIITFVITTVIMLIVGVVSGSLVTFCTMKKRKSITVTEHQSPTDGASGAPFYEQVSPSNPLSKEELKMDENVAYGHVQQHH